MVWHIIHKCVTCSRLRGKLGFQKMADLPDKRYMEAAPFNYSGVNMFIVLPSLHVSPVVLSISKLPIEEMLIHLLYMALHRFLARRVQFDANNKLQKALKEMDYLKVKNHLQGNGTDWILWHKNPPGASHMGRMWECQIRTARRDTS